MKKSCWIHAAAPLILAKLNGNPSTAGDNRMKLNAGTVFRRRRACATWLLHGILIGFAGITAMAAEEAQPTGVAAANSTQASGTSPSLRNLSLEQLMAVKVQTESTVSRVDERTDQAPGSVFVYTREMIEQRGYHSLGELLSTVPGFAVFHRDLQYVVSVRGLTANDNDKITLLVNGQRVLGLHEQEFLNGPINLDNLDRVEVVVGPSSFFQQADTLAGTVNLITKNVEGVEAIAAAGNKVQYSTTLMAGHHWDADKFVDFSFSTENLRGFNAWNNDWRPGLAGRDVTGKLESPSFFSVLNGQYDELTAQVVAYRSQLPELNIDSDSPLNNGVMTEQYYSMLLKDEHPWTDTLTSVVNLDAAYKKQTRIDPDMTPINANQQSVCAMDYEGEMCLRYTGFKNQLIQAGVQLAFEDDFDSWFTYNAMATSTTPAYNTGKTTQVDQNTDALGFYIDDTIQATKWLKLIGGIRVDENTRLHEGRWFPGARAAIILDPTSTWVSKLIYNRSVRMPSASRPITTFGARTDPSARPILTWPDSRTPPRSLRFFPPSSSKHLLPWPLPVGRLGLPPGTPGLYHMVRTARKRRKLSWKRR